MKKRIYRNMMVVAICSLVLLSVLLTVVFYFSIEKEVYTELKEMTRMINESGMDRRISLKERTDRLTVGMRYTLIDPLGNVTYDSGISLKTLENHSDRKEFREAVATGEGRSKRYSQTINRQNYYYAALLQDGTVLRVSKEADSVIGIFWNVLPYVGLTCLVVLLLGRYVSIRILNHIMEPIHQFDFERLDTKGYEELVPFIREVTKQKKKIEEQISDLQAKVQTISLITSSMKEGLVLLDEHGIVMSANKSAMAFFDTIEPMENKSMMMFSRNGDFLKHIKMVLNGERTDMEYHRKGRFYQIFMNPAAVNGAILLLLDITERRQAEIVRREFTANVSHELKTPISTISGYAEMIHNGMVEQKDIQNFAGKIAGEAERLIILIEDIMMLSELEERGRIGSRLETFEMDALVKEVFDALRMKAEERDVSLHLQGRLQVKADRRMFFEMLYNLVDNAIKYNKKGGVATVELFEKETVFCISVRDTGIGIPKDQRFRIFERFYRVDKSRSKKTGGTGLGLSIVKHIVQKHNGKIEVYGTDKTVFLISIPKS